MIVTRNRRELLRISITAVTRQTRPVDRIIVVDNASEDDTPAMLEREFPEVRVVALPVNVGGAGGFYEGIRAGCQQNADWLWLMDDDTIPRPTALAELMGALGGFEGRRTPAVLASRVEWRDGTPHPMNEPTVQRRQPQLLIDSARVGLLPLRASSFVSILLATSAVERGAMPRRGFFYQADDVECTARILRHAPGYFVPRSVVEHHTPSKHTATDDDHRFYFHLRNQLFMLRGDAWDPLEKVPLIWGLARSVVEYLRKSRLQPRSVWTFVCALTAGLTRPVPP